MRFSDYCDYLRILNDSSAAEPFRAKAKEMAAELFLSGDSKALLRKPFTADSVVVAVPFYRSGDSLYAGLLGFRIPEDRSNAGVAAKKATKGTMNIFLSKRPKIFGKDTLNIWGVFLGTLK